MLELLGEHVRDPRRTLELARKLIKEMDDHRNVSVSRVYVPNEYTIYLSAGDHEQFESYEKQLRGELAEYLSEHARRENYVLLSPPRVQLETDEDLDVGVFGIATRMVQSGGKGAGEPEGDVEPNATMVYKPTTAPPPQATEAASAVDLGIQREVAVLSWEGEHHEISKRRVVLGRSKDADLQVADPNASRRHAELRQEGATYWLIDLDSTNGVEVGGKRVKRLKLEDGTRFTIGSTEISFSRELQ